MSDFFNPPTSPVAAKQHCCIFCFGPIPKGERHRQQTGNCDGRWFSNRFHDECWDVLVDDGDFEFVAGGGEPPERIQKLMEGALS